MFKCNSVNVHSNRRKLILQILGACQNSEPAGCLGDYGHFLNAFAKSVRASIVLSIE